MGIIELSLEHRRKLEQQQTVSDKIRLLDRLGYARADIARILGKRYQHVRNVLEQDRAKQNRDQAMEPMPLAHYRLAVEPGGSVSLPEPLVRALSLGSDRMLIATQVDGAVQLISPARAVERARALLDPHLHGRRMLSDDLLADRREEAGRERSR